ncbi:MAG: EI24 domain-containing protein [Hydrogenovibrio sp.]|uniref:EI24 domain-containing protein n=1 Tax=Hydrogenovibrio sp. TaxID=2065821 RepID=UPI00286FE86D|nr:EI24 domain-containing protein [Hydrogenovibrio sp.]MDR9498982.1 EI24 domain-containing protein [Hydrogenovibrio sp.]
MGVTYLWKTLVDLKEPAILVRLFVPFVVGLIAVSVLGYAVFGWAVSSDLLWNNPWMAMIEDWENSAEQTLASIPLIGGFLLWLVGFLVTIVAGVLGIILGSYLVLLFAMIVTAFMTDSLVKAVHDKHYPYTDYAGHGHFWGLTWKIVKYALGMLLLLLVTLPLLFIPLVNILWFWLIGFLFFRYALVLDVGQVILPKPLFDRVKSVTDWTGTMPLALWYLLSVLPILSFFAPVLGVITLAHYYFDRLSLEPETAKSAEPAEPSSQSPSEPSP